MFQSSSVHGLQFILIGIGLLFQVLAVSALRRETSPSSYLGHEPATEDETPKAQPSQSHPTREKIVLPEPQQQRPQRRERDYYEMEKTPPGVPAAELVRTARVTYIRN